MKTFEELQLKTPLKNGLDDLRIPDYSERRLFRHLSGAI
jgi:hypothetical protein